MNLIVSTTRYSFIFNIETGVVDPETGNTTLKLTPIGSKLHHSLLVEDLFSTHQAANKKNEALEALRKNEGGREYLTGDLVGANYYQGNEYGFRKNFMVRVTSRGIEIYNLNGFLVEYYSNPRIKSYVIIDGKYSYCMQKSSPHILKKFDIKNDRISMPKGSAS